MKNDDGDKFVYLNGQYHREDGPALEFADGTQEYWLDGMYYEKEAWAKEVHKRRYEDDYRS